MAYDEELAARVRARLGAEPELTETPMFGGLAFLVGGHMALAVSGQGGIMVRVDPDASQDLRRSPGVSVVEMRGRPTPGWLRVTRETLDAEASLAAWADRGVAYARSLPAK